MRWREPGRRQGGLILEAFGATVPELEPVIHGVENGWRIALADAALDADGGGTTVREGMRGIVTCAAGYGSIRGQPAVEEELLAEGDFFRRLRIAGGNRGASRFDRKAGLLHRFRARLGTGPRDWRRRLGCLEQKYRRDDGTESDE
jgi:hypothetical protein